MPRRIRRIQEVRLARPPLVLLFLSFLLLSPSSLEAQVASLRVTTLTESGDPLAGVLLTFAGRGERGLTASDGRWTFSNLPAASLTLEASRPGYRSVTRTLDLSPGEIRELRLVLAPSPFEVGGIQVSVLRPDLRPEVKVDAQTLQEINPHDVGAVLRALPGLDAMRRGGLGLDPVVRGLRDTQVGAYVDGMRTLPGGPAGMDTPLSHVDPSAVRGLQVVKGPYALTWGAGNMSAIRVETVPLPDREAPLARGRLSLGYDSNLSAGEGALEVEGAGGLLAYNLSGAWRESENYTSGSDLEIPSSFLSRELRGRLGFRPSEASTLILSGWVQEQRDIDFPGRPLDARWFDTENLSLRWTLRPPSGRLQSFEALVYGYRVDHGMDNDAKPTALANPNRMPPFPLDILTTSSVELVGGRVAGVLTPGGGWTVELGADFVSAHHDAESTTRNRTTDALVMRRLIWGGARLETLGAFVRGDRALGPILASGALRVDRVRAEADSASAFFLQNVTSELRGEEDNVSGALTLTWPFSTHWSLSGGAGSVLRPADANERYSDRSPSKKSQISAEFVGDPGIRPERSRQVDLWVEASYPRWRGSLTVFGQQIQDHITLEETQLPRQSAMSAPTVYRYVNGEAEYLGAELSAQVALPHSLQLVAQGAWLRGEDKTLDEPLLGVSPLRGDLRLRWSGGASATFMEGGVRGVASQDRISTTRGEIQTPGYTTIDLQGGLALPIPRQPTLRVGVQNLLDKGYVNHLNARNPFTGLAIEEPGRVLFARLSVAF
jgi:iron complex outermembrane recepter protein